MSECMTIDIFPAEEKHSDDELISAKDIVQSILTDALHSAVINTVPESNLIGDFKTGEEFQSDIDSLQINSVESGVEEIGESREEAKCDREEEKSKEYKVIKDQALADSELRIENGKIHLQSNGANGAVLVNLTNFVEICHAKEVNKSQSCVYGDSDKKVDSSSKNVLVVKSGQEKPEKNSIQEEENEMMKKKNMEENVNKELEDSGADYDRPFIPFTTEELRKSILEVWKNVNSPTLNGWKEEMVNQPEEVVRLMEELATIQVTPKAMAHPKTDTSCYLVEENIEKQQIKEVKETDLKCITEDISVTSDKGIVKADENTENRTKEVKAEEEGEVEVVDIFPSTSIEEFQFKKFSHSFDFDTKGDLLTTSLTDSDEAFIEAAESVIQVIEPQDETVEDDDENNRITFSLLNELYKDDDMMDDSENRGFFDDDEIRLDRQEETVHRFRSGMTTVGPVKSQIYDPKLLTGPEIDYGRMTRISGSRELKKNTIEESISAGKVILDEIDESPIIFFDNSYDEFDTIVNHDIASLTKMQKVREVLSDKMKSDEDLRDDEKIMKPPLDLKDVDGDSCDSYNVLDISIPLMPMEETNRNNINKNICQRSSNGSGLRNMKETNSTEKKNKFDSETETIDDHSTISSNFSCNKSTTQINTDQNQKHNTISRVLQKASSRFIAKDAKDNDSFLRNSKSLPRDTSRQNNNESLRSLLDDCQTSAVTVLKKSKSLLRTTQNAFKVVSKTGFGQVISGEKQMHSVEKSESRQSTASKKSDFVKLKDSIKSNIGKTLKHFESEKTSSEVTDQGENHKKLSPKSPHVCPNQLPSKNSSQNQKIEFEGSQTVINKSENFDQEEGNQIFDSNEGNENPEKEIEVICEVKFQGSQRFAGYSPPQDETRNTSSESADYAIIETVSEVKTFSIEDENNERPKTATGGLIESGKRAEIKKSSTLLAEAAGDVHIEGESMQKSLSNGKLTRKNKKFSARIRRFWQTAFGKVKATSQKKDAS